MDDLKARIRAAALGHCIGDALGAPVESLVAGPVEPPVKGLESRNGWPVGKGTDDTLMMLACCQAYRGSEFDPTAAMMAMVDAARAEPGRIGQLSYLALELVSRQLVTPLEAGHVLMNFRQSLGNGSLMRALPTAIVRAPDDPRLVSESVALSVLTHAHSVCTAACAAYCFFASSLLRGNADLRDILHQASTLATNISSEVGDLVLGVAAGREPRYQQEPVGYVLLALERALLSVMKATDFRHAILDVVNQGADSDTHGALAGALLGGRFGLEAIPHEWRHPLVSREAIETSVRVLAARM